MSDLIKELNKEHIFVILAPTPDSAIITIMLLNQENGYWKRGKKTAQRNGRSINYEIKI